MARKRGGKPEVWVTILRDLCSGDAQCAFSGWFRARHWVRRTDPTFDKATWEADHTNLVNHRAVQLGAVGYAVQKERQNEFRLEGHTAWLVGKPDILARATDTVVSDEKTGQQRNGDWWQVLIYMLALPPLAAQGKILPVPGLRGEVVYQSRPDDEDTGEPVIVQVPPDDLSPDRRQTMVHWMQVLAAPMPPEAVPSGSECGGCPLSKSDCPVRVEPVTGTTDMF